VVADAGTVSCIEAATVCIFVYKVLVSVHFSDRNVYQSINQSINFIAVAAPSANSPISILPSAFGELMFPMGGLQHQAPFQARETVWTVYDNALAQMLNEESSQSRDQIVDERLWLRTLLFTS